ncbi:MAG: hypothetical protein GXP08_07765 [Gammaproteobacteria bacterium]|nr:hypothetical protein [Gammaproteobacteria bacterium]
MSMPALSGLLLLRTAGRSLASDKVRIGIVSVAIPESCPLPRPEFHTAKLYQRARKPNTSVESTANADSTDSKKLLGIF